MKIVFSILLFTTSWSLCSAQFNEPKFSGISESQRGQKRKASITDETISKRLRTSSLEDMQQESSKIFEKLKPAMKNLKNTLTKIIDAENRNPIYPTEFNSALNLAKNLDKRTDILLAKIRDHEITPKIYISSEEDIKVKSISDCLQDLLQEEEERKIVTNILMEANAISLATDSLVRQIRVQRQNQIGLLQPLSD